MLINFPKYTEYTGYKTQLDLYGAPASASDWCVVEKPRGLPFAMIMSQKGIYFSDGEKLLSKSDWEGYEKATEIFNKSWWKNLERYHAIYRPLLTSTQSAKVYGYINDGDFVATDIRNQSGVHGGFDYLEDFCAEIGIPVAPVVKCDTLLGCKNYFRAVKELDTSMSSVLKKSVPYEQVEELLMVPMQCIYESNYTDRPIFVKTLDTVEEPKGGDARLSIIIDPLVALLANPDYMGALLRQVSNKRLKKQVRYIALALIAYRDKQFDIDTKEELGKDWNQFYRELKKAIRYKVERHAKKA